MTDRERVVQDLLFLRPLDWEQIADDRLRTASGIEIYVLYSERRSEVELCIPPFSDDFCRIATIPFENGSVLTQIEQAVDRHAETLAFLKTLYLFLMEQYSPEGEWSVDHFQTPICFRSHKGDICPMPPALQEQWQFWQNHGTRYIPPTEQEPAQFERLSRTYFVVPSSRHERLHVIKEMTHASG